MILYIKYMVSLRCKLIVKTELKELGLQYIVVDFGEVEILEDITQLQRQELNEKLFKSGLELLDKKNSKLIDNTIVVIFNMIEELGELPNLNYQEYISKNTGADYKELSKIFLEVKCVTIQQFININKIEKVKEFLLYDDLSIKEITLKMKYRNISQLTSEFKKITGLSLNYFKQIKKKKSLVLQKA